MSDEKKKKNVPIEFDKNAVKVDLSEWDSMEPIIKWNEASARGDFRAMVQIMTEVVKSWPFESDPAKYESYVPGLHPKTVYQVAQVVGAAVSNFFQG